MSINIEDTIKKGFKIATGNLWATIIINELSKIDRARKTIYIYTLITEFNLNVIQLENLYKYCFDKHIGNIIVMLDMYICSKSDCQKDRKKYILSKINSKEVINISDLIYI